jgi:RNA polymerase sigma-70 factor, ECF subfamily
MASTVQNVAVSEYISIIPTLTPTSVDHKSIYEQNRHRVYAIAFWMTNNELEAEAVLEATFVRAFAEAANPTEEQIDNALIAVLREDHLVGILTLNCADATEVLNVRGNTKRVHLELAVVQLPATEKLIFLMHDVEAYSHARIARTLGISTKDSKLGLHQARLRMRELVGKMAW